MGGGGSTNTNTIQNQTPWGPQAPFITAAFDNALGDYNTRRAQGPYTGNITAGGNGYFDQAENIAGQQAGGAGANNLASINGMVPGLFQNSQTPNYMGSVLAGMGAQGAPAYSFNSLNQIGAGNITNTGADPRLSGALSDAAIHGAGTLSGFTSGLQGATQQAAQDPTQRLIANAGQYMNSAPIQQAIDSSNAMIDQTLHEDTLPGLNRQAAMGGALNSSRAGMAEASANRNAAIAKGNANSAIMNNAFNTGLGTAANEYNTGLNAQINGNVAGLSSVGNLATTQQANQTNLQQTNIGNLLQGAQASIGAQQGWDQTDANIRLGGMNAIQSSNQFGVNAAQAASGLAGTNASLMSGAGGTMQQQQQAEYNNLLNQWQMQNSYNPSILKDYFGITGTPAGTQGSSAGVQSSSGPGVLGNLVGLGTAGLAANNMFAAANGGVGLGGIIGNAIGGGAAGMAASAGLPLVSGSALAAGGAPALASAISSNALIGGSAAAGTAAATGAAVAGGTEAAAAGAAAAGGASTWGSILAAVGSMFSDVRLKEHIVHVGQENGHNIYDFNYIGQKDRYRGVMAQEVIQSRPDAVTRHRDGYLMVNYSKLGLTMKRVK